MSLNTLIIGAGAIGCLTGAKLALSNQAVTLAGRASFVQAMRERGLSYTDEAGQRTVRNIRPAGSIAEAFARAETAFDLAVLTVKSYDTAAALEELCNALANTGAPAPAVLSMQNGVGNEDAIAAALQASTVIAGSITTPVSMQGPGAIRVDKPRYGLGLSVWRGAADSPIFTESAAMFTNAGFAVKTLASAPGMKWTKLLMNMMGNAIVAILGETPEKVFADNRMIDLEISAWREAMTVMDKAGIPALNIDGYPFATLAPLIRTAPGFLIRPILRAQIGGARGGKLPSLAIDLQSGKPRSEVFWLNGAVVDKGKAVGVPTPVNRCYCEVMEELLEHPEQRDGWRGAHDRLFQRAHGAGGR